MPTEGVGPERERDWAEERAEPMAPKEWLKRWAKLEGLDPDRIVFVYEPALDTLISLHTRQARRDGAEDEFEHLYGIIVGRIQADIAGDFEAGLNQLEYNAREKGRRDGAIAALERVRVAHDSVKPRRPTIVAHRTIRFVEAEIARLKAGGEV